MKQATTAAAGYETLTEKASRAVADGRERRVYTALAKAGSKHAWVATEFPAADFTNRSASPKQLSPSALENRQRAGRYSAGFKAKLQEQLAEERSRLQERLQRLASSCQEKLTLHTMLPEQYQQHQQQQKAATATSQTHPQLCSKQAGSFPSTPSASAASTTDSVTRTERRPATPPTLARDQQQQQPLPQHAATTTFSQPSPYGSRQQPQPQREQEQPNRSTGTNEQPTPRTTIPNDSRAPRMGARRRLSYDSAAPGASAGGRPATTTAGAAATATPPPSGSPYRAPSRGAPSGSRTNERPHSASPPAAAAGKPDLRNRSSTSSRSNASSRSNTSNTASLLTPTSSPTATNNTNAATAATAVPGVSEASGGVQRGPEPLELLVGSSLRKMTFAGHRSSQGPHPQPYDMYDDDDAYAASHVSHRERLRAGVAELSAGLHASWRALLASGAV
ncbi:hypothetical protein Agub_g2958 [Astrephomene gubernaculifera]|uniref:Uncharacterized protein n=1 Tax=Astrephomene gubernaculifera TaxID=47775 RepID=A0AAD3DHW0_9CHLO|nr:hypothetical protein Agub_g2958 [Astrephomene gubernaculifera]